MEWLLGKRIGLVPVNSDSVNDAIIKGEVSKTDAIGLEIEPDKGEAVSFTWTAVDRFKFVELRKHQE